MQSAPLATLSVRPRLQGRAQGLPQPHQLGRRPGREVPSELGAGCSCRAFAPYALRLAGQGPGGSERRLRAETGSPVPPAGHGHPGGGHLSFSAHPGLWKAHALFTVCPSDCCVAGWGSLPVSALSGMTSPPALPLPLPSLCFCLSPSETCRFSVSDQGGALEVLTPAGPLSPHRGTWLSW